ncbi:MAG: glutamate racemase [Oscillospiraceae bacterium]|nr:glutamate racemase [Oscillospiraceae bacterium]
MDNRPIGVFDSGLGGLTVLKEIRRILPNESIVYFGDCGRTPYGVKSPETVRRYTFQNTRFFLEVGVKLLVIACNTSSACAYGPVAGALGGLGVPVVEVIRPGAAAAASATRNRRVGVIGTAATIASGVYVDVLGETDPDIQVFAKACPLFVPIAEEGPGWWDHVSARIIAEEYLGGLRETGIDVLLLGCTHYPLLGGVISAALGGGIMLVSSAQAVAAEVSARLGALGLCAGSESEGGGGVGSESEGGGAGKAGGEGGSRGEVSPQIRFYTSDSPEKFEPLCGAILGEPAGACVQKLDIDKYESRLP